MDTGVLIAIVASVGVILASLATTFIVLRNNDKDNEANFKRKQAEEEKEK